MLKFVRSHIMIPAAILLGVVVLILALISRWQGSGSQAGSQGPQGSGPAKETTLPWEAEGEASPDLDAWKRPSTTDAKEYAIAFGRAIWTYDTSIHSFSDWQNAVSAFADPMGEGPRIARSMLPYFAQWQQLELHKAKASVTDVTADSTPQLQALEHDPKAPEGWHGYLVRGKQTSVLDSENTVTDRQVTVGVVCLPGCKFWSATTETPA
jgi:hypothetical protein